MKDVTFLRMTFVTSSASAAGGRHTIPCAVLWYDIGMELAFTIAVKILFALMGVINAMQLTFDYRLVLSLFLALAFSFAVQLPKNRTLSMLLCGIFCLLPLALPVLICFLPLIVFDACYRKEPLPLLAAVPAFFVIRPQTSLLVLILIGCVLAAMLALALSWVLHLREELQQVRDDADSGTRQASLEKKELTAQQDAEIEAATLQERNRIAREIHDNVGHMLSRAILLTGALQTVNKNEELYEPLQKLNASLNDAMNSIRESVHDLYDDSLDLERASKALLEEFHFCPVDFRFQCSRSMPREVKYCFFSILKEALVNIAKHSGATKAEVSMTEHPALYQMIVQDNGTGQAAGKRKAEGAAAANPPSGSGGTTAENGNAPAASDNRGIGLVGMSERVNALGGTIRFNDDKGFRIFLTIPKAQEVS